MMSRLTRLGSFRRSSEVKFKSQDALPIFQKSKSEFNRGYSPEPLTKQKFVPNIDIIIEEEPGSAKLKKPLKPSQPRKEPVPVDV